LALMKAMLLTRTASISSAPLQLEEVAKPSPGPGEILVKVRCCAICRTDLHVIEGELPPHKRSVIPGHQAVGVVEQTGERCERVRIGERVGIAWLRSTCGQCEYCTSGRENLCQYAAFTGYDADGGYAEYATVREDFAYRIPAVFSDVEAAPLLCAGIIGYRSLKRANPRPNCRLALYGFGSSAHVVIQIARKRGYEVYVATRGQSHRELAKQLGATWVGENAQQMPELADSAIIFAPAGELVPPAIEKLKKGGTLALAGIYMSSVPAMEYEKHLFYERDLRSVTCNTREDGIELLAEAAEVPIRPHVVKYPLEEANRALMDLKGDRISGTGVLMIS
jgi:propanol-preferring alcohol dehydrogenase